MTAAPLSPRFVKGGIVTMDPDKSAVNSVIALQYNPDSLSRAAAAQLGWQPQLAQLEMQVPTTMKSKTQTVEKGLKL